MSLKSVKHQKSAQAGLSSPGNGEAESTRRSGETPTAAKGNERSGNDSLMEQVVERSNAKAALKRVRQNKGSPGTDGMTVDELPTYLVNHWEAIRAQLLDGSYQPKPVRRQEIPKSSGGVRELGIPCVRIRSHGGEATHLFPHSPTLRPELDRPGMSMNRA
jgi:RNA-directed DNA polymerase